MESQTNDEFFQFDSMKEDFSTIDFLDGDNYFEYLVGSDVNFTSADTLYRHDKMATLSPDTDSAFEMNAPFPAKSPWHESDSGVSESLSFLGSPSDQSMASTIEDFQSEVQQKNNSSISIQSPSQSDDSLMTFLLGEAENEEPQSIKLPIILETNEHLSASGRPIRKCARRNLSETKISCTDSSDINNCHQQSQEGKVSILTPPPPTRKNVINIVKIVKPSSTDVNTTSDEVMKALHERSKKNAEQAKVNREKKKAYIQSLENDRDRLKSENNKLSSQIGQMSQDISALEEEVEYLKSVLVNASALSGILKNISNVKEVKLSATMTGRKRVHVSDHSYNLVSGQPERQKRRTDFKNAGVCLHVANGEASLEFCAQCSLFATKTQDS